MARFSNLGLSRNKPNAMLQGLHNRPRTFLDLWQWSTGKTPLDVPGLLEPHTAHFPSWASSLALYSSTVIPYFFRVVARLISASFSGWRSRHRWTAARLASGFFRYLSRAFFFESTGLFLRHSLWRSACAFFCSAVRIEVPR